MSATAPICVDLFCGLGGWAEGFLAEGYQVLGFDIGRHDYGSGAYPGQLVLQDALTIWGGQLRNATCIVASPPCQWFSYTAMPFSRGKALAARARRDPEYLAERLKLFQACFRIQREASEAAGRHIPMVVENVCGAQPWVGRAPWNYGSYYLWGDIPALMPVVMRRAMKRNPTGEDHGPGSWFAVSNSVQRGAHSRKNAGGSWFNVTNNTASGHGRNPVNGNTPAAVAELDSRKVPGFRFDGSGRSFQTAAVKTTGHVNIRGGDWFNKECGNSISRRTSSRSTARKAASAQIAKIPLPLARHIARCFKEQI